MSVSIGIHLVTVNGNDENIHEYITQAGSDELALMLLDWKSNSPSNYKDVLSPEEISILTSTYGEESMSVLDNLSKFQPNIRKAGEIVKVMNRVRNRVLYPAIKDEAEKKGSTEYLLNCLIPALMAISECIAILSLSSDNDQSIYIALNDY